MSGMFFGGVPSRLLRRWSEGAFSLVSTPQILSEYRRVADELSRNYPGVEAGPILDLVTVHSEVMEDQECPERICRDPDDEKFLLCASAANAWLVSGDKDLLAVDGVLGVKVVTPRTFDGMLEGDSDD